MKTLLQDVIEGRTLGRNEMRDLMISITHEQFSDIHLAAFFTAIRLRGETVDEILGLRDGLLITGTPIDLSDFDPIDLVGTGGDGKNTFNISTCACFVVAGAGFKVAKHGNFAATSVSGASHVIQAHGVAFTADPGRLRRSIEESGIAYLHAPLFAHGMKFVAPMRRALQVPTAFNLLGPLVNPAQPRRQLLGTATLSQLRLYHNIFERLSMDFGIVSSTDGYDEISLTADFKFVTHRDERVLRPSDLGMERIEPDALYGGRTVEEARTLFDSVLDGTSTPERRAVVLANAAAALSVCLPDATLDECLARAVESLDSGRALQSLRRFIEVNS